MYYIFFVIFNIISLMSTNRLLTYSFVYIQAYLYVNISSHVEDLECGFLVLATKEKSKCISLDNVLKHSHLKEHRVDQHDSDDDVELLVSKMRHLPNMK